MSAYQDVVENIAQSCKKSGRDEKAVHLIAVSKTYEVEDILPLLDLGHRQFGENRVQESQKKWPDLQQDYSDIVLHLIGPLQSNKAAEAVALFDVIHTVDRPKIAKALAKEMQNQDRFPKLLVQVNTGEEVQKAGVLPADLSGFLKQCDEEFGLKVEGLMCIPPVDEEAALHFALLEKMAQQHNLAECSMGMSSDYDKAIALGATMVRVGTAIFGQRATIK